MTYLHASLPATIRARVVDNGNDLQMHFLEAGKAGNPSLLLLHGFPELAYSWRKAMVLLADAGYHILAPDQRGYGPTAAAPAHYDDDLVPYRFLNLVRDVVGLRSAVGIESFEAVIGHDFGAMVAYYSALARPDLFRRLILMSAPVGGPPASREPPAVLAVEPALEALVRPRKHYQYYYTTPAADRDMLEAPAGIHAFLRAYSHHKSADWLDNRPHPLQEWTAGELAKLPTYYVMDYHETMATTVARHAPPREAAWLTDDELAVYAAEFARTGFQGGLNWYRVMLDPVHLDELRLYADAAVQVPAAFIAGAADWGVHQAPGAFDRMQTTACADMRAVHLIEGAGHWVQQERPDATVTALQRFLETT
ncbi:MAG: alpha/beta hydrolase [Rhodospirillales bacterium]|nr:alpha/beta hydrolase [Rhodospirillales bacterium]